MTFLELITQVEDNVGRTDKRNVVKQAINNAVSTFVTKCIALGCYPRSLQFLTAGILTQGTFMLHIPIANAWRDVLAVLLDDGGKQYTLLRSTLSQGMRDQRWPPSEVGRPLTYAVYGYSREDDMLSIVFDKIADKNYTIKLTVYRTLTPMQNDGDLLNILDASHIIVAFATGDVYQSIGLFEDGVWWQNKAIGLTRDYVQAQRNVPDLHLVAKPFNPYSKSASVSLPEVPF